MKSISNLKGVFLGVVYSHIMLMITAIGYDLIEFGYVDFDDLLEYGKVFVVLFIIATVVLYIGNIIYKGVKDDVADLKVKKSLKKTA